MLVPFINEYFFFLKLLFYYGNPALFVTILIGCLLVSITGYSLYVGFGPPAQELRDPFEEHED